MGEFSWVWHRFMSLYHLYHKEIEKCETHSAAMPLITYLLGLQWYLSVTVGDGYWISPF